MGGRATVTAAQRRRADGHARVVMVEPTPGMRGPQRTFLALARYLGPRLPLTVAVPEGFVSESIRVEALEAEILALPFHSSRTRSWLTGAAMLMSSLGGRREQILIHANGLSALNLAAPVARKLHAPVFVHFHAFEITARNRLFLQVWRRLGVKMAIYPVSAFSRGLLEAAGGRSLVRGILPNPIGPTEHAVQRSAPHQPFRVGWMGSKSPRKGLHHLVRIAYLLRDEDVVWLLYGIDLETNRTDYVKRCLAEIDRLGLGVSVRWRGKVEDPSSAYAKMDALLVPSERENLPRVVLEAMESGLPVVATGTGSTGEAVTDGVSGWLFDPDHPDQGAEQLRGLVNDRGRWKSQSIAAVQAAGRFDVTTVGQNLERFYGDVLGNGAQAALSAAMDRPTQMEGRAS